MNNFKKIGISALAGSMLAVSAHASEVAVSGTVEVTYTTNEGNVDSSTGNPIGMKNNIGFSASGDVNGYAVTYTTTLTDAGGALVSTLYTVDLGDLGVIGVDQGMGSYGVDTADDSILPTAYEEPSHGGGTASLNSSGSSDSIGYKNTFGPLDLNLEYNFDTGGADSADGAAGVATTAEGGSNTNFVLSTSPVDGLTVGFGYGKTDSNRAIVSGTSDEDSEVLGYVKYAVGPVSLGYTQSTEQTGAAGSAQENMTGYAVAFNVNDNLSISYADRELEFDKASASAVTEDSEAIMAAYTMGSASLRAAFNEHSNVAGVSGVNDDNMELSLVLSF